MPVSVIYGPNGSGKSNVLEALHTLDAKVLRPLCAAYDNSECEYKARKIPVETFVFSEETKKKPTEFEVFFRTKIAEYRYILRLKQEFVVCECLNQIKLDTRRSSILFIRNGNQVELKGVFGKIKISEELSENLLLLSYLGITYKRNEVIPDAIEWFEESIDFLNYGNPRQELRTAMAKTEEVKRLVLDMIREMDLDNEDFRIEKTRKPYWGLY